MKHNAITMLILGVNLLLPGIAYTAAAPAAPAAPILRIPAIQTAVNPHLPPVLTDIIAGYDTPVYEIDTAIANRNWQPEPGQPMPNRNCIRTCFPIVALTTQGSIDDRILTVHLINYNPGMSCGACMTYIYDPTTESLVLQETMPYGKPSAVAIHLSGQRWWNGECARLKIPTKTPRKVMYIMEPDNRHTEINVWVADHNPTTGGTKLHYTIQHLPSDIALREDLIKARDAERARLEETMPELEEPSLEGESMLRFFLGNRLPKLHFKSNL